MAGAYDSCVKEGVRNKRETYTEKLHRIIAEAQASEEKAKKALAFLEANPGYEEMQELRHSF